LDRSSTTDTHTHARLSLNDTRNCNSTSKSHSNSTTNLFWPTVYSVTAEVCWCLTALSAHKGYGISCHAKSPVHTGNKVQCRSDFQQKSILLSRSEWTGAKVDRTGDNFAGSVDFVAIRFDFLHIHELLSTCRSSDIISVKWQTIKTNYSKISYKKKHLSILTGTSNDAEKYAAGICGSRPKHRSGPSLIRMKFCLCRPSIHTGRRSFRHRLLIFVAWMSKVAWTFDSVASVYRAVRIQIYHYKGCSINKLQNNIILLIFKIWKFEKICSVGNLVADI